MIFINNKYTSIYYSIITRAQSRALSTDTYTESHHIIPKSLGGTNYKDNLVHLTPKEHRLCHLLLVKMTSGNAKRSMVWAANIMLKASNQYQHRVTNKLYTRLREELSISMRGANNPNYGKKVWNSGKKRSPEFCQHMRELNTGKQGIPHTDAAKEKIRQVHLGVPKTEEAKKKMSIAKLNAPKIVCEYCQKGQTPTNYLRWHGTKCKLSPSYKLNATSLPSS